MHRFYVGQKVVCIDDGPIGNIPPIVWAELWECPVKKGEIYQIRWHGNYTTYFRGKHYCVRLEGIVRDDDLPLAAERFKPLLEKKTDISVFQTVTVKSTQKIDA